MGFISDLFKKEKPLLKPEDIIELEKLKREAYMEEARKIVAENGKQKARKELTIKQDIYS